MRGEPTERDVRPPMRSIGLMLICWIVVAAPVPAWAGFADSYAYPPELAVAIAAISPGGRIVGPHDMDGASCGASPSPGLVAADFNGDGREDFAVLLKKSGAPKEPLGPPEFTGLWFVVFLADHIGALRPAAIQSLAKSRLGKIRLEPHPAGIVTEKGTNKQVAHSSPGILRRVCGKSAVVFHWSGSAMRRIEIDEKMRPASPRDPK